MIDFPIGFQVALIIIKFTGNLSETSWIWILCPTWIPMIMLVFAILFIRGNNE